VRHPAHLNQALHGCSIAEWKLKAPAASRAPTGLLRNDQTDPCLAEINNVHPHGRGETTGMSETGPGRSTGATPRSGTVVLHQWSCHQVVGAWYHLDLMQQVAAHGDSKHLSHRGLKSPTADGNCADAGPNGPVIRSGGETCSPQNIDHCHPREGTRGVKTLRDERRRLLALEGEKLKIGTTLRPEAHEPCGVALKPLLVA